MRAQELWRVAEPWLAEAQEAATLTAIRDQEEAGLDIIGDGEMRRESYSNRLATALSGIDIDNPGVALDRTGADLQQRLSMVKQAHAQRLLERDGLRKQADEQLAKWNEIVTADLAAYNRLAQEKTIPVVGLSPGTEP